MSEYESVMVINQGLESKTSKTGKQRFTIRIEAEPVFVVTDPKMLGAPIAQAIAHHLRERVKAISAIAAPATLRAREVARRAFVQGKPWAMKRYAGGRMGARMPAQSETVFNDSGRFAESIRASASKDGAWRVDVAANRLDPKTGNVDRIWRRLLELVPDFGDIGKLLEQNQILERTMRNMISKGKASEKRATAWDAIKATAKVVKQAADLFAA